MTAFVLSVSSVAAATWNGTYDVSKYVGGKHGLWLQGFFTDGSGSNYWGVVDGTLTVDDHGAQLDMSVKNHTNHGYIGDLSVSFTNTAAPASAKCEYGACPDTSDWRFFDIAAGSFTGGADLIGMILEIGLFPDTGVLPGQIGIGTNSKNNYELGLASWNSWMVKSEPDATDIAEIDFRSETTSGQHGDINISLSAVPLPAAGWLLIAGLGGLAMARRKTA